MLTKIAAAEIVEKHFKTELLQKVEKICKNLLTLGNKRDNITFVVEHSAWEIENKKVLDKDVQL